MNEKTLDNFFLSGKRKAFAKKWSNKLNLTFFYYYYVQNCSRTVIAIIQICQKIWGV